LGINSAPTHFISVVDNALVLSGQVPYFTKVIWNKNKGKTERKGKTEKKMKRAEGNWALAPYPTPAQPNPYPPLVSHPVATRPVATGVRRLPSSPDPLAGAI
jgi:hypothetical protein